MHGYTYRKTFHILLITIKFPFRWCYWQKQLTKGEVEKKRWKQKFLCNSQKMGMAKTRSRSKSFSLKPGAGVGVSKTRIAYVGIVATESISKYDLHNSEPVWSGRQFCYTKSLSVYSSWFKGLIMDIIDLHEWDTQFKLLILIYHGWNYTLILERCGNKLIKAYMWLSEWKPT